MLGIATSGCALRRIGKDASAQLAGRNAAYDQVRQNNLGLMMADIARNRADAGRDVRFGLQRSGLFGGSVDIAANRDITDANQLTAASADEKIAAVRGAAIMELTSSQQSIEQVLRDLATTFADGTFSANEAISIVENAGLMGLPIPAAITKAIDILKQRAETPEKGKD